MTCPSGKAALSPGKAKHHEARHMNRPDHSIAVQAYHCGMCGNWHVGSVRATRRLRLMHRQKLDELRAREIEDDADAA